MNCTNCNKSLEIIRVCGKCKIVKYCSSECQLNDWRNGHKQRCFDLKRLEHIVKKCDKAGLIRHINGNTLDNRIQNLQRVSALDSIKNPAWTIDAVCHLNDDEMEIWNKARKAMPV